MKYEELGDLYLSIEQARGRPGVRRNAGMEMKRLLCTAFTHRYDMKFPKKKSAGCAKRKKRFSENYKCRPDRRFASADANTTCGRAGQSRRTI
jgi:hypothetical protein